MERKTSNDTYIEILTLHPFEMELLSKLRKNFRFGEVTIVMKDGLPLRIKRVYEIEDLTNK